MPSILAPDVLFRVFVVHGYVFFCFVAKITGRCFKQKGIFRRGKDVVLPIHTAKIVFSFPPVLGFDELEQRRHRDVIEISTRSRAITNSRCISVRIHCAEVVRRAY